MGWDGIGGGFGGEWIHTSLGGIGQASGPEAQR